MVALPKRAPVVAFSFFPRSSHFDCYPLIRVREPICTWIKKMPNSNLNAPDNDRDRSSASPDFIRRVLLATAIVILIVGGVYILSKIVSVLFFIFGGILLALFLNGIAGFISRRTGLWPRASLILVVLITFGALGSIAYFAGPELVTQANMLADTLPKSIQTVRGQLANYSWARPFLHTLDGGMSSPAPQRILAGLPGFFSATSEALTLCVVSIFVGIYAAADPRLYVESLIHLVPQRARDRARRVGNRLHVALGWWLVGRVITMTLMGILTAIGLWLLNVPMALTLGVISGLFQFVPYLGAFAAAVPAVLIALAQSPQKALEVVAFYLIVHSVEGYIVTPMIQRRAAALPPAALLCAQIIMGSLFGITGILFATPVAVVVIVLVQTLYLRGALEDHVRVLGQ